MRYEIIDHTADFGIRVFGDSEKDLFRDAGRALFEQIVDPEGLEGAESTTLSIAGEDGEERMFLWLRELLYLWNGEQKLVRDISVESLSGGRLKAQLRFDRYAPERHTILRDIKAVTYHQLRVKREPGGWSAQVIFDV